MANNKKKNVKSARKQPSKTRNNARKIQKSAPSSYGRLLLYGLVPILLVVVLVGFELKQKNNQNTDTSIVGKSARMILESDKSIIKVGDIVVVRVYTDSDTTHVNAVEAAVKYPSNVLELKDIRTAGSAYPVQAQQAVKDGRVELVRGVIGGVSDKQLVSELQFVAKQTGDAQIVFDSPGTVLLDAAKNKNILLGSSLDALNLEVQ